MLIVSDQQTVGIRRQGRLAGTGKAEENSRFLGLGIHVRGTVHGKHIELLRKNIVHGGEDALLQLTGILCAGDHDHMRFVVDHDGCLGMGAVDLRAALEAGCGNQREIRLSVVLQFFFRRTKKELVHEEALARKLGDDTELLLIFGIRSRHAVEDENFAVLQVSGDLALDRIEFFSGDGTVHIAPCNIVVHTGCVNDKFVFRAPPGIFSGRHDQCTGGAQHSFSPSDGRFRKFRR